MTLKPRRNCSMSSRITRIGGICDDIEQFPQVHQKLPGVCDNIVRIIQGHHESYRVCVDLDRICVDIEQFRQGHH